MASTRRKDAGDQLRSFIERVEKLDEEKRALADDIKSVYAEAKANGYDIKALRKIVWRRRQDSNALAEYEAVIGTYMHALGMTKERPLFEAVGAMSVDKTARAEVVEAFKQLVPANGEVVVKMGGSAVRLLRDTDGVIHAEDVREDEPEKERTGKALGKPSAVLSMVPKSKGLSVDEIKRIVDDAEKAGEAKRGGVPKDAPVDAEPADTDPA